MEVLTEMVEPKMRTTDSRIEESSLGVFRIGSELFEVGEVFIRDSGEVNSGEWIDANGIGTSSSIASDTIPAVNCCQRSRNSMLSFDELLTRSDRLHNSEVGRGRRILRSRRSLRSLNHMER